MTFNLEQTVSRGACAAFTLMEVLISLVIFALVTAGIVYGYAQSNRFAEWSQMSLAAQSIASEGVEQARAAVWSTSTATNIDDLAAPTNYTRTNYIEVPTSGQTLPVTNYISITTVTANPPVRQILVQCEWQFPLTGKWFTNTVIAQRAEIQ
ncbi:MAG: prepilin-type N-terminal cleavage/methylation domain-containing protein [Verrucomicrobiota bacterium]